MSSQCPVKRAQQQSGRQLVSQWGKFEMQFPVLQGLVDERRGEGVPAAAYEFEPATCVAEVGLDAVRGIGAALEGGGGMGGAAKGEVHGGLLG